MRVLLGTVLAVAVLSVATTSIGQAGESALGGLWDSFKRDVESVRDAIQGEPSTGPGTPPAPAPGGSEAILNRVPAQVAQTQDLLNQLGYSAGPVDGAYGGATRAAIMQFEARQGLRPTGDVSAGLIEALQAAVASRGPAVARAGAPAAAAEEPRYDGEWVRELQSRLTSLGLQPGPVDGQFGARTAEAIAAFQSGAGLAADGIPSPSLMRALRARTQGSSAAPVVAAATGPSFETSPEVDYQTLLAMLLAATPEAFDNDAFALYYASLQFPSAADRGCLSFLNALGNEISRRDVLAGARGRLDQALAASAQLPEARVFRLTTRDRVGEYDFERGGFPIETRGSSPFGPSWRLRSQLPAGACSYKVGTHLGEYRGHRIEVPVPVAAADPLLAMAPEQAQAFIDRNRARSIEIEWLIEVRRSAGGLSGRVVGARARDTRSGAILHVFDPARLQPPAAAADPAPVATLAPPLTPYLAALHALRALPDLLDREQLIELTRVQVIADQRAHDPAYAALERDATPVFTAEQVEGRLPELAAEDLAPAYRRYLAELAAAAPSRVRAEHGLGGLAYDSAAGMLRCCGNFRRDALELLPPVHAGGREVPYGTPAAVADLPLYQLGRNQAEGDQGPSVGIRNGIQRRYLPGVRMLAFDRRLELPGVALERERAEQLLLELRGQRSGGLTAVVEFTIEGAQLDASSETGATPVGALLARLDQVTIRTSEGREVARYEADAFPLARPAEAAIAAAAAPQSQPPEGPPANNEVVAAAPASAGTWPAGAAFGLVSRADSDALATIAFVKAGLDPTTAQQIGSEQGLPVVPVAEAEAVPALTLLGNFGLLVSAAQFDTLGLAGLEDLKVVEVGPSAVPAVATVATEPAAPPPDQRAASEFEILDLTVGMVPADALAALAAEFSPDQIDQDAGGDLWLAERGPCQRAAPGDAAIAAAAGSFCVTLRLADGVVSGVVLRQVVAGEVVAPALAALRERYGEPVFVDERAVASGVLHTALGWGEPARAPRPDLGRRDLDVPATVLEADVWAANGVTVAVLRLDAARTAVADRPASQGIKF